MSKVSKTYSSSNKQVLKDIYLSFFYGAKIGIDKDKLVAFTGVHLADDSLYKKLNELRIPSILGTLGNLDKRAEARGDHLYKEWAQKGIQIFSTDRPFAPKF